LIEANDALSKEEYEKALSILHPLVDEEVPGAIGMLGVMYQLGSGVPRNLTKAVELLTKAYELGDGTAAHNLGTIYAMGEEEIKKDHEKSKMYYRKAKEMGAQYAPDKFYE
jgi:TPR repeat protein